MDDLPYIKIEFKELYQQMFGVMLGNKEIDDFFRFVEKNDIEKLLYDDFVKIANEYYPDQTLTNEHIEYEDNYFRNYENNKITDYYNLFENEEKKYILFLNDKKSFNCQFYPVKEDDGKTDAQKDKEGVIQRRGRPTKKTPEEVMVLGSAGVVGGFILSYVGDVIGNIVLNEPDPLTTTLFWETYLAAMFTGAVLMLFIDMDPFALAVLAAGVYRMTTRSIKELVGRPFLDGEEYVIEFIQAAILIFFIIKFQTFYVEFFRYRYRRRHPYKKSKLVYKDYRPSFTKSLTFFLTNFFLVFVILAVSQSQNISAQRETGEFVPTPQNPNPQGNQQQNPN